MGEISPHVETLLLVAATSRYPEALAWGLDRAREAWGAPALVSDRFDFTETDYYRDSMGTDLKKEFWAFPPAFDPADLPETKSRTNDWEAAYAKLQRHTEKRPLNLDPGYLSPAKLVLASTKDHSHRVYLRAGVYAEVTLHYRSKSWRPREWTYPDYRRADFHEFFTRCRELLDRRRSGGPRA